MDQKAHFSIEYQKDLCILKFLKVRGNNRESNQMNMVKRLNLFPFTRLYEFQLNKATGHNGVISTISYYNRSEIKCYKPKKETRGDVSRHTEYLKKVWKT